MLFKKTCLNDNNEVWHVQQEISTSSKWARLSGVTSIVSQSNITGLLFKLSEFVCPLSLNGISFDIPFVLAVTGFSLRVLCINFLKLHYKEVLRFPNRLLFNQSF